MIEYRIGLQLFPDSSPMEVRGIRVGSRVISYLQSGRWNA